MDTRPNMQSDLDGFVSKSQFVIKFNGDLLSQVNFSIKAPPLENFVFEGGGVCGYVYSSAIAQMFETHELNRCKRVAGSSAGAINALAVALGMDSNEILRIIGGLDFTKLVEVPLTEPLQMLNKLRKKGYINEGNLLLEFLRKVVRDRITYLIEKYPDELTDLNINPNCVTFKDLRGIGERLPNLGIKEFFVTATEFETNSNKPPSLVVFSADNPEYENIEMALGVLASAAIPKFFKPVEIPQCPGKSYIDGGCMCNFPMNLFEAPRYAPKDTFVYRGEQNQNLCTFGFKVDTEKEMRELLFSANQKNMTKKIKDRLQQLLAKLITKVDIFKLDDENADLVRRNYAHRVCQIDNKGISLVKFNLSDEDKKLMFQSGREHTKNWQDNYFRAPIVHDEAYPSFEAMCESIPIKYLEALRSDIVTGMAEKHRGEFSRPGLEVFFSDDRQPLVSDHCVEIFAVLESVLARRKHESMLVEMIHSRRREVSDLFKPAPHLLLDLFMLKITPHLLKSDVDSLKEIIGVLAELITMYPEQFHQEMKNWHQENIVKEMKKVLRKAPKDDPPSNLINVDNIARLMTVISHFAKDTVRKESRYTGDRR